MKSSKLLKLYTTMILVIIGTVCIATADKMYFTGAFDIVGIIAIMIGGFCLGTTLNG